MITHIWSVLCKESIINEDTKVLSIRDVLENLQIVLTPAPDNKEKEISTQIVVPVEYEIVSFFARRSKDFEEKLEIEFSLIDPKGKKINTNNQILAMAPGTNKTRVRTKIVGMPIRISGEYSYLVKTKQQGEESFKQVAELPLDVSIKIQR